MFLIQSNSECKNSFLWQKDNHFHLSEVWKNEGQRLLNLLSTNAYGIPGSRPQSNVFFRQDLVNLQRGKKGEGKSILVKQEIGWKFSSHFRQKIETDHLISLTLSLLCDWTKWRHTALNERKVWDILYQWGEPYTCRPISKRINWIYTHTLKWDLGSL